MSTVSLPMKFSASSPPAVMFTAAALSSRSALVSDNLPLAPMVTKLACEVPPSVALPLTVSVPVPRLACTVPLATV